MQRVVGDPDGNATPRRFGEIPGSLRNPEAFQFVLQAALELAPIRLNASEGGEASRQCGRRRTFRREVDRRVHVDGGLRQAPLGPLQKCHLPEDLPGLRRIGVVLQTALSLDQLAKRLRMIRAAAFNRGDLSKEARHRRGPSGHLTMADGVAVF